MTLLIHIVGRSDLGIDQVCGIMEGTQQSREDLADLERPRLQDLASLGPSTAASVVVGHLLDGVYSSTTLDRERSLGLMVTCRDGTPLRAELRTLGQSPLGSSAGEDPSDSSHSVLRVMLVGSDEAKGATRPLAEMLHGLLSRPAVVDAIEQRTRVRIEMIEPCIAPGLAPEQAVRAFENAIEQEGGRIVLSAVSGAINLFASCAGVLASSRSDKSALIVGYAGESAPSSPFDAVLPKSLESDSLRGWLMGLGLPTLLAPHVPDDDEVTQAAEAVLRAAGMEPDSPPTSADLGLLLLCDVARGDLAAGMALRSWIKAEYLRQRRAADAPCPDQQTRRALKGQLGGLLQTVAQQDSHEEYDAWLIAQTELNDLGKRATHDFAGGRNDDADTLRAAVLSALEGVSIERPSWLSWPGPEVCIIIPGHRPKRSNPKPPHPKPPHPVAQYLGSAPSEDLREACATAMDLRAHILLLASDDTKDDAEAYAKDPESHQHVSGWAEPEITVRSYGPALMRNRDRSVTAMRHLQTMQLDQLEGMATPPRAVVVFVAGERFAVLAALRAAQEYGALRGVPVFLQASVERSDKWVMSEHQFGLDRDVRATLLDAAVYCLDRLDLLTAKRLLLIGDQHMRRDAEILDVLADRLSASATCRDMDFHAPTILAVLQVVADSWDRAVEPDLRARLMTIVGELLATKPASFDPVQPWILATTGGTNLGALSAAGAGTLLRVLVTTRNKTTFTHGTDGPDEALTKAFQGLQMTGWEDATYPDLIRRAIDAVRDEHGITPSDWADDFRRLRCHLEHLRDGSTPDAVSPRERRR